MSTNDTDVQDDVDIPEAEPLPPLDAVEKEAAPSPLPVPEDEETPKVDDDQEEGEPPPLPPLLELAGSNLATAGGAAYGAVGPAGLLAVGAVATVGAVAYMARSSRKRSERRAGAGGAGAGQGRRGGRFRGLVSGAGAGRGSGGGRGLTGRGRSGGASGVAGRGRGGAGALGRGRAGAGAASGGLGRRGAGAGSGRGRFGALGSRGGARAGAGRSGGLGGVGSAGSGRSGTPSSGRWGGSGVSGASRGGARGRSGGSALRGFGGGGSSGSLFGGGRGSSGRRGSRGLFGAAKRARGRTTSISDPAMPLRAGRRPLRGAFRAARRGWDHPRVRRGRFRFKRASVRTRDYMHKRIRRMKAKAFWQALAGWWGRLWGRVRGDHRYGPMSTATATAVALSVALLGPGRRAHTPRGALTGRIIGTSARTPGELHARDRLALSAGDTSGGTDLEGHVMKKPGEIIRAESAADEMRAALATFGSADVHMLTYEGGLQALPGVLRTIGAGLHDMSSVAEGEQPLHPAVLEYMHQISAAVHQVAAVAEELPGLFRAAHETELQRLEAPRAGEHRWDASQRDD